MYDLVFLRVPGKYWYFWFDYRILISVALYWRSGKIVGSFKCHLLAATRTSVWVLVLAKSLAYRTSSLRSSSASTFCFEKPLVLRAKTWSLFTKVMTENFCLPGTGTDIRVVMVRIPWLTADKADLSHFNFSISEAVDYFSKSRSFR